ncbi:MAG: hypothetical protein AAF799_43155 [Myxococcota bacterium]
MVGEPRVDAEGRFPTVGFERRVELELPFAATQVCPLFEPSGRNLLYEWWEPTVLRPARGQTLEGLVTVSTLHESHEVFLVVTEHEPERGHLQYMVLWDDFELQRVDITCVEGASSASTKVEWLERNAGLHDEGVSMVSSFVMGGALDRVVERYGDNVEKTLRTADR